MIIETILTKKCAIFQFCFVFGEYGLSQGRKKPSSTPLNMRRRTRGPAQPSRVPSAANHQYSRTFTT